MSIIDRSFIEESFSVKDLGQHHQKKKSFRPIFAPKQSPKDFL